MIDILKEINNDNFDKELTKIDFTYFMREINKRTGLMPTRLEVLKYKEGLSYTRMKYYYSIYVFIEKSKLLKLIGKYNLIDRDREYGKAVIFDYDESGIDEIISSSKFILKESNYESKYSLVDNALKSVNVLSDKQILNFKSNSPYVLVSLSDDFNQEMLDRLCLEILIDLNRKNIKSYYDRTKTYRKIKEKILKGETLEISDIKVLSKMFEEKIDKIDMESTLYLKSLKLVKNYKKTDKEIM